MQVDIAMPAAFPTVKTNAKDISIAGAIYSLIRGGDTVFHRSQSCDHLECRTGRVRTLHRLSRKRAILILVQIGPILDGNTTHKQVGIKGRGRGDGTQITILKVNYNCARAFAF